MPAHDDGDNRPPCYYDPDGTFIIRASAIGGSCLWDLVAAGQGHEPNPLPANMKRAFREGHELEPMILERLVRECAVTVESTQEEGHLGLTGGVRIRFHPDGLAQFQASAAIRGETYMGPVVVEIKALSDDLWWKAVKHGVESTIGEYKWQASVMMHATGRPLLWAVYNKGLPPGEDGIKPECKDQGKLYLQLVHTPFIPLSDIALKALEVKELVDGEDILETGRPCDDPSHWPCRFLHLRPETEDRGGTMDSTGSVGTGGRKHLVIPVGDMDEVDTLVRNYIYHKGQAEEHSQRKDQARDQIIALLGGDTGKIETEKWVVPVVNGSGAKSIAWDEMTEEDKARLQQYLRAGKKYKYIRGIKRKDGMDEDQD